MSAQEGHPQNPSATHQDARVHRLERVLRTYGALTRPRLYEVSGAARWGSPAVFEAILAEAVRAGRVHPIGDVLLAASDA